MSDRLLQLGRNRLARSVAGSAGLSLPPSLRRSSGPWEERPLEGRAVAVLLPPGADLAGALAPALAEAGAAVSVLAETLPAAFLQAGEAWGRPPRLLGAAEADACDALVLDATGFTRATDTRLLFELLQPRIGALRGNGRVLILGRPPEDAADAEGRAARRAVEGFVRSLAKELGRKGSTANELRVPPGAEDRLAAPLRWLLSDRSAYVSGQPWRLSAVGAAPPARWTRPVEGKVALVTGAARGIGAATAAALAREGARVVLLDRPEDADATATLAASLGGWPLPLDLVDPAAPAAAAAFLAERWGGLDLVVHNAGVTRDKTLSRMDAGRWDLALDVNLHAVLRLQAALDPLLRPQGRVVCLSSIAGLAGNVGQTNYAASKAAIAGYTAGLAAELADRGVAVNAIAPGFIETRLTAAIPLLTREGARRLCNLSQGGLPEDVAEAVLFLCSPGAAALSGQTLRVCGGSLVGA